MKKDLKNKIALIIAVLVVCLYGIFGVPSGFSGKALTQALTNRIHLGLDLRGGVHLILQVVVSEAVSAETDNTVQQIKQDLQKANLAFTQVYNDPQKPELIRVDGLTPASSSAAHSLLDSKYSNDYDLASGGSDSSLSLTMKPLYESDLEKRTVQQAI
ncbi:MAG: protein translocase subunit SecD, partial [Acidobacteriota bacterium]|nr:protein translocase subunit SecD [Acidobacteriota bacterium]